MSNISQITKLSGNRRVNDYDNNQDFWYGKILAPAVGETLRNTGGKIKVNLSTGSVLADTSVSRWYIVHLARAYYKLNRPTATEAELKERIKDGWNQVGAVLPYKENQVSYCTNRPKTLVNWLLQIGYGDVIELV